LVRNHFLTQATYPGLYRQAPDPAWFFSWWGLPLPLTLLSAR